MDLTDEALVENFQQTKDASYFKSLVRRYQNRIYSAAYRILGNQQEAEEVVQETYIRVHQNMSRFRRQCTVGAWIFRITHNICVDNLRSRKRQPGGQLISYEQPAGLLNEGQLESISQVADSDPCPAVRLDMNEQSEVIQQSLNQLPDNQRTVLVLHDIEGVAYQDIAEIVGASIGTVRSRLHYGRLKLRQLLAPYFSNNSITPTVR